MNSIKKAISFILILFFINLNNLFAEYPDTSVGVIDLNYILSEAKAAKKAAEDIDEIAEKLQKELAASDQSLIDEQNKLIESQAIMAPNVFDEKRIEYEKKVQNYNIQRQEKILSIDQLIADSRNEILNSLKPLLENISNEKGITILLEKNSVLLNAESMDITEDALKMLNRELPQIEVNQE